MERAVPRAVRPLTSPDSTENTSARFVAPLVVAAFFLAFGALHYGFYTRSLLMDTPIYERYGDAIVHDGRVPYADFAVEYPPGALPVFAAPSVVAPPGDFGRYREVFEAIMLVCGAIASALVGLVLAVQRARPARLIGGTLLAGLAPLALGPVVLSRFDLWPAMLTIAGLAAVAVERRRLGCGLLGAAFAAKIYPGVVLPLALAYVYRRHGRREGLVCAGVALGTIAVLLLPFAVLAPHGLWASVSGQADRPLQIESLGASFLLAAHEAWGLPLTELTSHGSQNLGGHVPHVLAQIQSLVMPLAVAAIWVAFLRGTADRDRFLRYSAAAVCAFIALGKVLSPQYLIWLFALVPLVRGRRGLAASALFVASLVLTQLWFPTHYFGLAFGFAPRPSWLVFARDLVLVALLATLLWPRTEKRRLGLALVGTLVTAAGAATVAAAAGLSAAQSLEHSGLLLESGTPSTCAARARAPATSAGTVAYRTREFESASGTARCVRVTIGAGDAQLFSAAYLGSFDPRDATRRYLGSAGQCSNIPGAAGKTLTYSFRIPPRARYAVEVEDCSPGDSVPAYSLRVTQSRVAVRARTPGRARP